ncbi:hypothetical protein KQI68_08685 [Peptoniphilus sp. MSJ-1]|uniref:Uncharacterized protein n=1 Tax=Peptoniphilus ovalis TaxID=2841503 RepID=A0ABS6FIA8_9FIRM|nr:hypothetical protein [Peptoniphilus ovalis]MBU5669908.1 hypothetical protein [Peptoniphilus ovalis]
MVGDSPFKIKKNSSYKEKLKREKQNNSKGQPPKESFKEGDTHRAHGRPFIRMKLNSNNSTARRS